MSQLISSDPSTLSGTPVFFGTRVPVKNLTDCLEAGDTIDHFLDSYPSVSREQVIAFLEEARIRLTADASTQLPQLVRSSSVTVSQVTAILDGSQQCEHPLAAIKRAE